ncbi:MAG: adenosine deaminase [Candidatus Eremiobacteraeota bacterium]|nr:adenosine deaminase [Candidatus Eremiobacteraeota bacterium]
MHDIDPAIASLPKIHLHCHLEGTLQAETFVELTRRYGISTRYVPGGDVSGPTDPSDVYRFENFQEFLFTFAAVSRALARPDDYARLAREFVADALAQNVVYGELFISPSVWSYFNPNIDVHATIRSIVAELNAVHGAAFALIVDVTRNFGAESAMRTARLAADLAGEGVIGIGLGGDEARYPAPLFGEAFAFARAQGLNVVAHAGEAAGAQSVRDAVEILGAQRIGHGIRALEDPAVMDLLRDRLVPLEICPTSNFLTGAASRERPHPLRELDAAGLVIAIDADDPTLFGTSISQEYACVAQDMGMDALRRFVHQAVDISFLDGIAKQALHGHISAEPTPPLAKS